MAYSAGETESSSCTPCSPEDTCDMKDKPSFSAVKSSVLSNHNHSAETIIPASPNTTRSRRRRLPPRAVIGAECVAPPSAALANELPASLEDAAVIESLWSSNLDENTHLEKKPSPVTVGTPTTRESRLRIPLTPRSFQRCRELLGRAQQKTDSVLDLSGHSFLPRSLEAVLRTTAKEDGVQPSLVPSTDNEDPFAFDIKPSTTTSSPEKPPKEPIPDIVMQEPSTMSSREMSPTKSIPDVIMQDPEHIQHIVSHHKRKQQEGKARLRILKEAHALDFITNGKDQDARKTDIGRWRIRQLRRKLKRTVVRRKPIISSSWRVDTLNRTQ